MRVELQLCTIANRVIQHLFLFRDLPKSLGEERQADYLGNMILRLSRDNGIPHQLCTDSYLWQKLGLLQIQAFHLGTALLFSFLSQIPSIECKTNKREKKCDSAVGRDFA